MLSEKLIIADQLLLNRYRLIEKSRFAEGVRRHRARDWKYPAKSQKEKHQESDHRFGRGTFRAVHASIQNAHRQDGARKSDNAREWA